MIREIFVTLPVTDLARATALYDAVGLAKNHTLLNERTSGIVWPNAITVMLLNHAFHVDFADKSIIDARNQIGVLLCVTFDSREAVDDIHRRARAAGRHRWRTV